MANNRRRGDRAERLAKIADDVALDMTIREIAEKHGISVATAHKDVQDVKADWLASRNNKLEEARAVQVARLVRLIRELWDSWFTSKGWQFKLREEQRPGELEQVPGIILVQDGVFIGELLRQGDPVTVKTIKQSYYSPGNPRYTEQILIAYDQLAKIEGLYAAKQIDLNIRAYLEGVAEELGLDPTELLREAEDVAEEAWKRAEASQRDMS